jgi:hypothetical protein
VASAVRRDGSIRIRSPSRLLPNLAPGVGPVRALLGWPAPRLPPRAPAICRAHRSSRRSDRTRISTGRRAGRDRTGRERGAPTCRVYPAPAAPLPTGAERTEGEGSEVRTSERAAPRAERPRPGRRARETYDKNKFGMFSRHGRTIRSWTPPSSARRTRTQHQTRHRMRRALRAVCGACALTWPCWRRCWQQRLSGQPR